MTLPVRIVLVQPRNSENLGACARAMKNFGLSDWVWVEPYAGDNPESRRLAVHAEELLESARVVASLAEAVSDCAWVVGTTHRRLKGKPSRSARDFAKLAAERSANERVALVFGNERSGLSNEMLAQCHELSTIPTDDGQPSINLAQAVLLYGYELHVAAKEGKEGPAGKSAEPAADSDLRALSNTLGEALLRSGFLRNLERHGLPDLVAPWIRARLTRREARLWMAALRSGFR
jgi:TrmH family RNA methyltransferase